jgi:hypothetical protein
MALIAKYNYNDEVTDDKNGGECSTHEKGVKMGFGKKN